MNNYQGLFMFDECYAKPSTILEPSFNVIFSNSYNKYLATSVNDCEKQALRNNSEFFLINDISSIGASNYTNCYIPKSSSGGSSVIGDNSIIARALNLFNSTFSPYNKQVGPKDSCNNLLYNSGANNPDKCFTYLVDNKVYAPKKYYAYYKKPIINENNLNTNIQNPQIYKNAIPNLKAYESLILIDNINFINNGPLADSFKRYICDPSTANERYLDENIIKLKQHYESFFNSLDTISSDISSINYLNSFDDETIISLNVRINDRTKELNNLLGFGGANNGRLSDTTFLTQFKIVENTILLLVIITVLFLYNKIKK